MGTICGSCGCNDQGELKTQEQTEVQAQESHKLSYNNKNQEKSSNNKTSNVNSQYGQANNYVSI